MEFFRHTFCVFSICATLSLARAQGNYNPFQYDSPSSIQTPSAPGLQQMRQQQQFQIQQQNQQILQQQGYSLPNGYDHEQSAKLRRWQELQKILDEAATKTSWSYPNALIQSKSISTNESLELQQHFEDAYKKLNAMLSGKQKPSIADAYYYIETIVHQDYFTSYSEYKKLISQSVDFIKLWMKQNGYKLTDREKVHTAIQKFMSEQLSISIPKGTIETGISAQVLIHAPFFYDYNDYQAEQDHRNSFATKCWATGGGQCASMPVVYLSLAEGLGVKTYLTFAPYHSFIKYPDNNGVLQNYEPTSNWKITDSWYQDNMFISTQAKKNGIFLDTLNTKQIIANCMVDLAVSYMRTVPHPNDSFVLKCLYRSNDFFPNKNNLESCFAIAELLANNLMQILQEHHADKSQITQIPEALSVFHKMVANEDYIKALGYQEMPKGMYESMMNEQAMKGKIQVVKGVEGKQKRNLFSQK